VLLLMIANGNDEYAIGDDGDDNPLAAGDVGEDDKYTEDSDIDNNNDEYAFGNDGVGKPLFKGNNKYDTLSAARTQACPESQCMSMPSR
jgi:hypothetical protein